MGILDDYDKQFKWLNENGLIKCDLLNYYKLITKNSGYLINDYLKSKDCKCREGIMHSYYVIIYQYINKNNCKGLKSLLKFNYNDSLIDWNNCLQMSLINDSSEELKDFIKLKM